jgi:L-alanine-DL-glutamate epimerase-like enolase superfamily enzyme
MLLSCGSPCACRQGRVDAVARGYRHIKLHEHSVEAVAAARAAVGPRRPLMLDTNFHWPTVEAAREAAQAMQPYDSPGSRSRSIRPMTSTDWRGFAARPRVPIAAGENLAMSWMSAALRKPGGRCRAAKPRQDGGITRS